jgi:hypothetical protein
MKKKLLLINPTTTLRPKLRVGRFASFEPLGLGIIAALTPKNWNVKIIDENVEKIRFEKADLVGITAT